MRTVTFEGPEKAPRLGVLTQKGVLDAAAYARSQGVGGDFSSLLAVLRRGGLTELAAMADRAVESGLGGFLPLESLALLAPIPAPGKILGAALNYYDACERSGIPVPTVLRVFGKYPTAVNRPGGTVEMRGRNGTYEGELGVVIKKTCKDVKAADALDCIAGYTVVNDFTANDCIKEDVQLLRGKNYDGFLPMGPVFVTREEIEDPHNLSVRTEVDGELRQDGNTKNMIFNIFALIEYFSGFMTLEPGDVIATGTPAGTGPQFSPPRFVKPGQMVRVTVEGIGTLESIIG